MKKFKEIHDVDIKEHGWQKETEFTQWLCEDDNLEKLSNTIDVTLTDPKPEERLVDKICDIVCRDDNDDIVIIENQFGKSNHDHLGKLITYMSGKNAKKAIWIVGGDVSEDHISAIQWLNKFTDDSLSFWLLKLRLRKIENSPIALDFEIIEEPNYFDRNIKSLSNRPSTPYRKKLEIFWKYFEGILSNNNIKAKPLLYSKYITIRMNTTLCKITVVTYDDESIKVNLDCKNKNFFEYLSSYKDKINSKVGFEIDWNQPENSKACRLYSVLQASSLNIENNESTFNEIIKRILSYKQIIAPFIKSFKTK